MFADTLPLKMQKDELEMFLSREFPQVSDEVEIAELTESQVTMRLVASDKHLRPGGTISGPTMFMLADVCFYLALLSVIGPQALTVTTSAHISFMRKPSPAPLLATARRLKLGKTLAVGDVLLFSEGMEVPVAHASMTYAIPPAIRPVIQSATPSSIS